MKKLSLLPLLALLTASVFAEEDKDVKPAEEQPATVRQSDESSIWPSPLALCQWPRYPDLVGLRLTIPFSTSQTNVTGIDLGLWGCSRYFEGVQINVIRNDVKDSMAGFQFGLYNSIGTCELVGFQAGLWNEANSLRGLQVGLVNVMGEGEGLQLGIINRAETFSGYQIGVINVIRNAELQFMPLINIGF